MTTIEAIKTLEKTLSYNDFKHVYTILHAALLRSKLKTYNLELESTNYLDFKVMTYKLRPDQLIARPNILATFSLYHDGSIQVSLPRRSIKIFIETALVFSLEVKHES